MVNLCKCSISLIMETQFAIQSQVTQQTKLFGRSTCGYNNNPVFLKEICSRFLASTYADTLARQRPRLGDACQSGKMASLLESLFFVFRISLLPNYRVNYYDYIVKWCSGIPCNWCVSLDIALKAVMCVAGPELSD